MSSSFIVYITSKQELFLWGLLNNNKIKRPLKIHEAVNKISCGWYLLQYLGIMLSFRLKMLYLGLGVTHICSLELLCPTKTSITLLRYSIKLQISFLPVSDRAILFNKIAFMAVESPRNMSWGKQQVNFHNGNCYKMTYMPFLRLSK